MSTKRWLLLFLCIAVVCTILLLVLRFLPKGSTVVISQDGEVLYTIDLSQVKGPYQITVEWEGGYNTIAVTNETVWVEEADCGNQVCVNHGPLVQNGTPIICLPHHLVVQWSTP